jgi:hypothetical protein
MSHDLALAVKAAAGGFFISAPTGGSYRDPFSGTANIVESEDIPVN